MMLVAVLIAAAAPPADEAAIFAAAGFTKAHGQWRTDCDQQEADTYQAGAIDSYGDLNGDGRPEALVSEGSGFCYGNTGAGFWVLSKQANGRWTKLYQSPGMAEVLKTRGTAGMPDIAVGGPGFCFAVVRWNGKAYVQNRFEYEGKPCRPPR